MTTLHKTRLAKGLCAYCGAEAAPYRLCDQCRYIALIRRVCNRLHDTGHLQKEKKGRETWYGKAPGAGPLTESVYREAQVGDRRLHPRIKQVPIDIEQALLRLFTTWNLGPLSEEEIVSAWGKLRLRPGRFSVAHDLAYLIRAERRRVARGAKQARQY